MDVGLYGDLSARFSKVDKEDVPDQSKSSISPSVAKGKDFNFPCKTSMKGCEMGVRVGHRLLLLSRAPGWKRGINQNKLRNAKREDGAKQGITN